MGVTYGYIRVSTKDQNKDRQRLAMLDYGITDKNIIHDKQSGKDFDRSGYKQLLKKIKTGDTIVIKSIYKLGRNYKDIIEQWGYIIKLKRVSIVVLDMPLLDTRDECDLAGESISDIVLQLLSYVAESKRNFIKQRQKEGIEAAHIRGVKFGRKPKERTDEFYELKFMEERTNISAYSLTKIMYQSQYLFTLGK